MSVVKSALNPELIGILLKTKPVFKKRTPLWFFTNEINAKSPIKPNDSDTADEPRRRLKRTEIWNLWNAMRPEAKRRYFNMAEIDEVRYKEQKALWVAEIGSLISKQGLDFKKLAKVLEKFQRKNDDNSQPEFHKHYDSMIQSESTKTLYKELIDRVENIDLGMASETLISDVPKDCRPLLKRPRRPPSPFVIFAHDNKERLTQARSESSPEVSYLTFASKHWEKLSPDERKPYEQKYETLLTDYKKAMDRFRAEISKSGDGRFEQAYKERRAFRQNLRKKLREYDIVPVNVRNSFIFYLKENKGIPLVKLTKMWRELPESDKVKYKLLSDQDHERYYRQKMDFVKIKSSLDSLLDE